jgi:hypothetical protein
MAGSPRPFVKLLRLSDEGATGWLVMAFTGTPSVPFGLTSPVTLAWDPTLNLYAYHSGVPYESAGLEIGYDGDVGGWVLTLYSDAGHGYGGLTTWDGVTVPSGNIKVLRGLTFSITSWSGPVASAPSLLSVKRSAEGRYVEFEDVKKGT